MNRFEGIPAGRVEVTPLPNLVLTQLLPEIDDLAEAQVTLHIFYLLYRKKGSPRYVTLSELRGDPVLGRALSQSGQPFEAALDHALLKATQRGSLLQCASDGEDWYFFNTAESRRAIERLERAGPGGDKPVRQIVPAAAEPPNVFRLYEQYIGVLTPVIAEELKAFAEEIPPDVILDAFRYANENGKRTWSYVRKILLNWTREGKHEATGRNSKKRKPHFQGKFAEIAKKRGG
ncbi:MAG: DnaD domain-containing protein [Rudaea sp.]